jgi:hypothetical protein
VAHDPTEEIPRAAAPRNEGAKAMINKFEFTYRGTRNQCTVCGDFVDKFEVTVFGTGSDGNTFTVCAHCFAEPGEINEKLKRRAIGIEERGRCHARFLRGLIGQMRNLPTYAQWKAESDFIEAAYGTDLLREQWNAWTQQQRQAWRDQGRDAWHSGDPEALALVPKIEPSPLTDQERKELEEMFGS